ncbi:hypothetical protein D3C86_1559280 [compost metagenome]
MPDPGEAVADQRHGQQPPGVQRDAEGCKGGDHQPCADHMDAAAGPVGMFVDVIGIEGRKGGVSLSRVAASLGIACGHGRSLPPDRTGGKSAIMDQSKRLPGLPALLNGLAPAGLPPGLNPPGFAPKGFLA